MKTFRKIFVVILCMIFISPTFFLKEKPVHAGALHIFTELEKSIAGSIVRKHGWEPSVIKGGLTDEQYAQRKIEIQKEEETSLLEKLSPTTAFDDFDAMMNSGVPVAGRPGYLKVIVGSALMLTMIGILPDIYDAFNSTTKPTIQNAVPLGVPNYNNIPNGITAIGGYGITYYPSSQLLEFYSNHTGIVHSITGGFTPNSTNGHSLGLYGIHFSTGQEYRFGQYVDGLYAYGDYQISSIVGDPTSPLANYSALFEFLPFETPATITQSMIQVKPDHFPQNAPMEIEVPIPDFFPEYNRKILDDPLIYPVDDPIPETAPDPMTEPGVVPGDPPIDPGTTPQPSSSPIPGPGTSPGVSPQSSTAPQSHPTFAPDINPYLPKPDTVPDPAPVPWVPVTPPTTITPTTEGINWEPLTRVGEAITHKFPFSIPWDFLRYISIFNVAPVVPVFPIDIQDFVVIGSLHMPLKFNIDFTHFDTFAKIARWFLTIMFDLGIILGIRKWMPE